MILYYSGTGNSRYAAKRLAETLGEPLLSMNDRIKAGDTTAVAVHGRLVIVTPTYAWRIPRIVRHWLQKAELTGVEKVWFVMTCGSEIGSAAKYNRAFCAEKGLAYAGTAQLVMPENYIAMFDAPEVDEARRIVTRAEPDIDRAAACIAADQPFPLPRNNLYDRFMSDVVNPAFYAFFVKAKAFTVSDSCIGCGRCAQLCPMNNITLRDGRPAWGGSCTHCMACICYCTQEAIEYGKKSLGKPRYRMEAVEERR